MKANRLIESVSLLVAVVGCGVAVCAMNAQQAHHEEVMNVVCNDALVEFVDDTGVAVEDEAWEINAAYEAALAQYYATPVYYSDYSENYGGTDGLTKSGGVYNYDGRRETWYSSNTLYHYRTDEWTVDDEGFYRDSDGYYVVAASDKEQGEVFEGSKGECKVYDSGCAEGTTDYYVKW